MAVMLAAAPTPGACEHSVSRGISLRTLLSFPTLFPPYSSPHFFPSFPHLILSEFSDSTEWEGRGTEDKWEAWGLCVWRGGNRPLGERGRRREREHAENQQLTLWATASCTQGRCILFDRPAERPSQT